MRACQREIIDGRLASRRRCAQDRPGFGAEKRLVRPPARNSDRTACQAGDAVVIAGDSSAIDDAGTRAKAGQRFDDQREAARLGRCSVEDIS